MKIGGYYSVRNPCYGFCLAIDQAAVARGLWLSRQEVINTVVRLKDKKLWNEEWTRNRSDEWVDQLIQEAPHFHFSVMPYGLLPEGLQIAEQLKKRHPSLYKELPDSFKRTHLLVRKMQHKIFFPPQIRAKIVELTLKMSQLIPGADETTTEVFLSYLGELQDYLESAEGKISKEIGKKGQNIAPDIQRALHFVHAYKQGVVNLIHHVRENSLLDSEDICALNQDVLELLTNSHRFYFLPPLDVVKEWRYLQKRAIRMLKAARKVKGEGASQTGSATAFTGHVAGVRSRLFSMVGSGLIALTHDMSLKVNKKEGVITKTTISKSLKQIREALDQARSALSPELGTGEFFFGIVDVLKESQELLDDTEKELINSQGLQVFQALIEALICARRFMILPEQEALREFVFIFQRFEKIMQFLKDPKKTPSPLWHYGPFVSRFSRAA